MSSSFKVGTFFVFASASAFQENLYAWLRHVPGLKLPRTGSVLPLFSETPLRLPHAQFDAKLAALSLGTVTPDRDLYRQNHDAIRLLVVDPLNPSSKSTVELVLQGSVTGSYEVQLDANGAGLLELHEQPTGEYQARLKGQEQHGSFSVAEYRLVPLVAMLIDQRRQGSELAVTVRVETFGYPVEGPVRVDLMDRGIRLDSLQLTCAEGLVHGLFNLRGEGPHSLNIQRGDRTATVSLPGTRKQERELTLFSTLGNEIQGSLLPESGATEVRGLHLVEGATRNAPLRLERLDTGRARLVATARCEGVRAMIVEPARQSPTPPNPDRAPAYWLGLQQYQNGAYEQAVQLFEQAFRENPDAWVAHYLATALAKEGEVQKALSWLRRARDLGWELSEEERDRLQDPSRDVVREVMEPGDALELDVPAPLGVVAVGCYVQGRPWEGWAAVVVPATLEAALEVPLASEPGAEIELVVDAPSDASVFVLVRDSRLTRQDTPESVLASRLKSYVGALPPKVRQVEQAPVRNGLRPRQDVPAPLARAGMMRPGMMMMGSAAPSLRRSEAASFGASSFGAPPEDPFAASEEPLWDAPSDAWAFSAPMPSFEGGVASFLKPKPAVTTQHDAQVLLAELCQGPQRRKLRMPNAMGDFQVEAFVLQGRHWKTLRQRLRVVTDLHVELDVPPCVHPGDAVTGRVLLVGNSAVTLTRDEVPVELGPDLTFTVTPGVYRVTAGDRVCEAVVSAPGKLKRRVRTVRLMRAGETLSRGAGVLGWQILPTCELPLETLAEATTNYEYCCCEQTSTRMVAAAAMLELARSQDRVSYARAALRAGLDRLESMWLDGQGFAIYPGHHQIHEYWSRQAAVNLRALRRLTGDERAIALDDRVRRVYPDLDSEGLAGLYWSGAGVSEARSFIATEGSGVKWRHNAAYAVAILVRNGELELAVPTANRITASLNEQGMLYSTHDSVAALAMFRELAGSGLLNGSSQVESTEDFLRVVEGLATVQVDRLVEEDWSSFSCAVGLRVWFSPRELRAGEPVDLHVQLEDGYQMGDLVYVNLPQCLARVTGGAQVKQFAVDFAGGSEVTIPLVATCAGSQHFTLCVRNMFDEERAGSPGMLLVDVNP